MTRYREYHREAPRTHAKLPNAVTTLCGRRGWTLRSATTLTTDVDRERFLRGSQRSAPCLTCKARLEATAESRESVPR